MHRNYERFLIYAFLVTLLLSGCAGVAPYTDGEVMHLFEGFARWLTTQGDAMVQVYENQATGITLYARPLVDGWAVACAKGECPPVGYFMNLNTWKNLRDFLTSAAGGYTWVNQLPTVVYNPSITMPTFFAIPVMTVRDGSGHAWDALPCLGALCAEGDNGRNYWPAGWPGKGTMLDEGLEVESISNVYEMQGGE